MSTGERYTRAGFGVLDVIPGVKAFTTGAKAVGTGSKLLRLGDNVLADSKNIGRLAKGTMGEGLQAGKQAMHLRLSNAQKIAQQAGANVQRKLAKDWNDLGAAAKAIQGKAKQAIPLAPRERLALAGAGGSIPEQSVAGASAAATKKKLQEMMQKMDNLNVKGNGKADIIEGANGLDYLDNQLGSMKNNIKVNKYESAESVNNWWKIQGYNQPPYTPKTIVQEITLLEDTKLVRVYDGVESGLYGGWVMRAEDIKGLTPLQTQEKFALPQLPEFIGEVTLPKGSTIRAGEVNPLFGSKGGGFQFDMMQQRIGEFREIGKIIDWSGK
ncbi:hypothetical protein HCX59_10685 [Listeria welshimeri]|nr:hypothetical protein [Listeria welshimeri]